MFELMVKNALGDSLLLSPSKCYVIDSVDGLTPAGASVFMSEYAGADGARSTGAKIGVRNVVVSILPQEPVEANRLRLYDFFRAKGAVTVGFANGARNVRVDGIVETCEGSLFEVPQTVTVSILCPQPYWRDAAELVDQLYSVLDNFEFPFAVDSWGIPFSEIREVLQIPVRNDGETEVGLRVTMTAKGRVVNPVLYDATRRLHFGLNTELAANDVIILDTRRGSKTVALVHDAVETNLINDMSAGSTWLQLPIGETVIALDADINAELLDVRIHHDTLYQGV